MSATREPEVGEILLFCIDDSGIHKKHRPFLVVSVVDGDSVSGEVFADPLLDSKTKWALKLFFRLDKDTRTQWVAGALPGEEVGQWHFREQPEKVLPQKSPKPFKGPADKPVPLSQVRPR